MSLFPPETPNTRHPPSASTPQVVLSRRRRQLRQRSDSGEVPVPVPPHSGHVRGEAQSGPAHRGHGAAGRQQDGAWVFLAALLTGLGLGLGNPALVFSVFSETGKLLVRDRRSRVLRESGSGPEDEPVGQVRRTPHSSCARSGAENGAALTRFAPTLCQSFPAVATS